MMSTSVLGQMQVRRSGYGARQLAGPSSLRANVVQASNRHWFWAGHTFLPQKGFQTLAEAAPGHVAHVRSLVIDVLSPEQLRRLGRDADRIMSRIDTSAIN
jgi:hypothetical protein